MSRPRRAISLVVNGEAVAGDPEDRMLLADFLRESVGLTGTKLGCEHGVCGACTVVVDGAAVRACLMFAVQADGTEITTVESLTPGDVIAVLREQFTAHHALQCGFCTPGFLMTASAFLQRAPDPAEAEVREAMAGNICRCTGYDGIVDAVLGAARALRERESA